MNIAEIVFAWC